MNFALTLLVLLAPGDEPLAGSLAAAVRETLGPDATIELRVVATTPPDADVLALAHEADAGAVAVIEWSQPERGRAQARLYSQSSGRWLERELDFAPGDPVQERGRALGFTLGSMLPEAAAAVAQSEPAGPAAEPAQPAPAPPQALPAPAHSQPVPQAAAPWTFAIELAAQGLLAIGGEGSAAGGELGGRYRVSDHVALRAGAALGLGHIEALEADLLNVDLGGGLVWRSGDPRPGSPWTLALRLDLLARLQRLTRHAADERQEESHGRFLPATGVAVEATYALSSDLALFTAAGAHALLGETEVRLRDEQVAAFAPVDLQLALGLRVSL